MSFSKTLAIVPKRNPWYYAGLILLLIPLGIGSRKFPDAIPAFLAAYAGDVLWASLVYLLVCAIWPRLTFAKALLGALVFSYGIEVSQFCQADWLNTIRHTTLGALVLGFSFLWSDLVCYTVGIALAFLVDIALVRKQQTTSKLRE